MARPLRGWVFERWVLEGDGLWHLRDEREVEYDARHQRLHFGEKELLRVPRPWITALDELARLVLPAQT